MSVATLTATSSNTYNETRALEVQLRKRTSSFSTPSTAAPPTKLQRTNMSSTLRRSDSMSILPSLASTSSGEMPSHQYRVIHHYKDQRLKRKAQLAAAGTTTPSPIVTTPPPPPQQSSTLRRSSSSACLLTIPSAPKRRVAPPLPSSSNSKPPAKVILPSKECPITQHLSLRLTSPLSPMPRRNVPIQLPSILARRRDKAKTNSSANSLYRTAIITHMSSSPEGQKILHMGPRLAMSIINATKELERIVALQQEREAELEKFEMSRQARMQEREKESEVVVDGFDYVMAEAPPAAAPISLSPPGNSLATPVLTTRPWVQDDWEMIDCSA
ncbi:hypothetical protein JR316_0006315 [Psilocybe cubensis]|uniref:Uncharacterized protein n=2 Tax=Psilocybe cubensis TaxID=181762 RepID=A0ACB8H1B9_PSICU|nr:hypothetical protein JR316_0006315 [Psilocybe cubensis]KAH9481788.1 hypothetical protein JR316_0006315 [Psilocybe cubensis]